MNITIPADLAARLSVAAQKSLADFYSMKPGAVYRACWQRPCKVRKGAPEVIKSVSALVRSGIDYDAMASTQAGRADGSKPSENAGLPWGEWIDFPRVIGHKGSLYLRLYPMPGADTQTVAHYSIGSQIIDRETAKGFCLASEFPVREEPVSCFTLKLDTIQGLSLA